LTSKKGNKASKIEEEKGFSKVSLNWYPGHMAKTKKEIINSMQIIDIVIEILDARIPLSSRNPDIQAITKNKKKIILLNKIDLADEKMTAKWKAYFEKECDACLLVDCNAGKGINQVSKKIEELMEEEKKKAALRGRINKTTRVMILGIPNVGKSSFINRVAKTSRLEVANRPGVTRQNQWIRMGNNQELLDTPGVLWPKFENEEVALNLAFTGTIKDDVIDIQEIAYELLKVLNTKYQDKLFERYKIEANEWEEIKGLSNPTYELMKLIARKRGAIVSGGKENIEKAARIVLDDFRNGKIERITLEELK